MGHMENKLLFIGIIATGFFLIETTTGKTLVSNLIGKVTGQSVDTINQKATASPNPDAQNVLAVSSVLAQGQV